ncbi:MAG: alanine--tRNA ligase-related protein [Patescibacteria group bacterium]
MTAKELREKFLEFFKERSHAVLPSASLIPENDPTVLFTTAGMHPLVPFLLGEKHPAGKRLASVQKCIRTGDIDEVGDNWHNTFFEMLGNWSLGDYFKEDAIKWSWEFLTDKKWLGLDPRNLAVSVFAGDADAPFDEEAYKIWRELDVSEERIARLPKEDNWWGPAGTVGPCGPDTEMFFWAGEGEAPKKFDPQNKNWVEIWNDVFMEFTKRIKPNKMDEHDKLLVQGEPIPEDFYEYVKSEQKNIDTGMGLERTIGVLNGYKSVYETEFFSDLIKKIEEISGKKYIDCQREMRIIADHVKAAVMILGDDKGITPSKTGRGYVVRKLIRRAIRNGWLVMDKGNWNISIFAKIVIQNYEKVYEELRRNEKFIVDNLIEEEDKFNKTLERGLRELHKLGYNISGKEGFDLYQSYGLTEEIILDELKYHYFYSVDNELLVEAGWDSKKIQVEKEKNEALIRGFDSFKKKFKKEFNEAFKKHQELSRTASAGQFKGGLADAGVETTRLHTAAHLMLAALRQVLGDHVQQKGSNITAERLRFDFFHPQKVTPEEIKKVEDIVNNEISKKTQVQMEEMTVDEAKAAGATGVFEHKYGDKVKVYTIGDPRSGRGQAFSKEICGGPHVDNTGELGHFKIIREEASSAGIRRIKAVLEQ